MQNTDLSQYPAWIDQPIRYNDVDMQGHVNNTIFPVYFEAGRLAVNRGEKSPPFEPSQGVAVVKVTIQYLKSVMLSSKLRVGTRVSKIGNSSWTMEQALFDGDVCAAFCETIMVCTDLKKGAAVRLSDARRAYLEKFIS